MNHAAAGPFGKGLPRNQRLERLLLIAVDRLAVISDTAERLIAPIWKRPDAHADSPVKVGPRQYWARKFLSFRYIRGNGAEIGALHEPLPLYRGAKALYIDRYSREQLREHYPELASFDLIDPDIIDDGEQLSSIEDGTLDFLIDNHFI